MSSIKVNYLFDDVKEFKIVPLSAKREWMNLTGSAFAYRCVPLNVANTYGWAVINPENFTAEWNGEEGIDAIKVRFDNPYSNFAASHFGHGVLTISVDFILKTDPGISVFVRGIPNNILDNIVPLDGIVETDWLPFTFTYNYKFIKPGIVEFKKDEPLFSFFPIQRGFIEDFSITPTKIEDDKDFFEDYKKYRDSRNSYLEHNDGSFQKFYANGTGADGKAFNAPNHNKKTSVAKVQ